MPPVPPVPPAGGPFDRPGVSVFGMRVDDEGISMPGIRIDDSGIAMPGIRITDDEVSVPGVRIGKGDREGRRRRRRNRWEYLIGDAPEAVARETRLRVRTVSGSLTIAPGRGGEGAPSVETAPERREDSGPVAPAPAAADAARTAAARATPQSGGWPDSELYPPASAAAERATGPWQASEQEGEPVEAQAQVQESVGAREQDREQEPSRDQADEAGGQRVERTRLEILQAVERKELTVEEALVLLRELGG